MYVDETTVYMRSSLNLNDKNLAASFSSDLTQLAHWIKDCLVKFNPTKTKIVTFHHPKLS